MKDLINIDFRFIEIWRRYKEDLITLEQLNQYIQSMNPEYDRYKPFAEQMIQGNPYSYKVGKNYYLSSANTNQRLLLCANEADPLIKHRLNFLDKIHDIPTSYFFDNKDYEVRVTVRIDTIDGLKLIHRDYTDSKLNHSDYLESVIWKIMALSMPGCQGVEIYSFRFIEHQKGNRVDCDNFSFTSYDTIKDTVHELTNEFIEYLYSRNLIKQFLKPVEEDQFNF